MGTKEAPLRARSSEECFEIVLEAFASKVAELNAIPVEEVDTGTALTTLGFDSLVTVEIRNWIGKEMGAKISTMELMTTSDLISISHLVVRRSSLLGHLSIEVHEPSNSRECFKLFQSLYSNVYGLSCAPSDE